MKVLICAGIFPPEIGGPATYSDTLAKELKKRGHEVRVITYSSPTYLPVRQAGQGGDEEGIIRIARSRFKSWHYYKYYRTVKKYGGDADILYAQDPVSSGYPTYLAAKALKKPFVLKITGDYSWEQAMNRGLTDKLIDEFQSLGTHTKKIKKMREVQMIVAKAAKIVITPSEYLKKLVTGWGVEESKIIIIYNSIELPEISKSKDEVRKELGIKDNEFLAVSAGRNVPWKGFEALKEVFEEMRQNHSDFKLQIFHTGPKRELHEWIKAADVFVLNTAYEGLPHVILEAMALGTPVVTTNVCGNPEVVQNGQTGLLVGYNNKEQLKQAILRIYEDADFGARLAANAKSRLAVFGLENMIKQTEGALRQCAS